MNYTKELTSVESLPVLIIGDVMVDSYIWGNVERISPEAPVPVVSITHTENRLGGAANVAKNIAALKLQPVLCSVIGDDDAGKVLQRILNENGISSEFCIENEKRKTTIKTRIISGNHQILRVDNEQTNTISPEIENKLRDTILQIFFSKEIAAIIIEDYDKGVITKELIEFITTIANQKSIPILVDPKKRNFLDYKNITIFKPNLKEFTEGVGKSCKSTDLSHLFILAKEFIERQNVKIVMITLSENGIFVANEHEYFHVPSKVRHVADVSGAGDTVISTATACYLAQLPLPEIAEISNIAAGLVCEQPGVITIDRDFLFEHL